MIYLTSDLHFFHDREFIYKERGFNTINEMNQAYIEEWKNKVTTEDEIYILGDLCLGADIDSVRDLITSLPGTKYLIIGNHDTPAKLKLYSELGIDIKYADMINYNRKAFYLSHYPTITSNEGNKNAGRTVINLHGHIHTKEKFYENNPNMYNVSVDANNNRFLTLDEIYRNILDKRTQNWIG